MLVDVLRDKAIDRALIFTRTKHGADKVVRGLVRAGIAAEAIHGNKSQGQRERVLAAFRKGEIRTLVATDIAARGIDVDGISHVVNFDLPDVPETYVHRIGRTARAGAEGIAISLCEGDELTLVRDIEKLIRLSIPVTDLRAASAPRRIAGRERAAPARRRRRTARTAVATADAASSSAIIRRRKARSGDTRGGIASVEFLQRQVPEGSDQTRHAPGQRDSFKRVLTCRKKNFCNSRVSFLRYCPTLATAFSSITVMSSSPIPPAG